MAKDIFNMKNKPKVTVKKDAEPLTQKQKNQEFKKRAQQQFTEQIRSSVGQPYNSSPKRYIKDDPFTPKIGNVGPYRKKEDPFDQGPNDGMERKNPIRNRQVKPSLRTPLVPPKKLGQKPPTDNTDDEADDTPTQTKEQRRQRLKQDLLNKNKNKNKNNPTDKPEDDTPTTPTTPPASTAPPPNVPAGRPASNSWPDIIGHYFPEGAGNYFKNGGLVRGGGAAQRGTGRGKLR